MTRRTVIQHDLFAAESQQAAKTRGDRVEFRTECHE